MRGGGRSRRGRETDGHGWSGRFGPAILENVDEDRPGQSVSLMSNAHSQRFPYTVRSVVCIFCQF